MSSGNRELVFNTQEHVLSVDHNRAQKFSHEQVASVARYLLSVHTDLDDSAAGEVEAVPSTTASPLRGEVLAGLRVAPALASFALLVTPGVAFLLAPDNAADDSPYKYVNDAGVPTPGTLALAPNAAGLTRIDVVECSWGTVVAEQDNRDILDLATGNYAAALVPKVRRGVLTYRVRQGTPGGGFPGTALGWLPLAVASVPAGAASNDVVTFWDVRPLVGDRVGCASTTKPTVGRSQVNAIFTTLVGGWVDAVVGGRRLGGALRSGMPTADLALMPAINFTDAANQAAGFIPLAHFPYYLYLCTPFGLPRWARYSPASAGVRMPRSPRGLPVVTNIAADVEGRPLFGVALPASCGLGGSATVNEAVVVAAGFVTNTGALGAFFMADGKHQLVADDSGLTNPIVRASTSVTAAAGSVTVRYDYTQGLQWPAHAREVLIEFRGAFTTTNGAIPIDKSSVLARLDTFAPGAPTYRTTQQYLDFTLDTKTGLAPATGTDYAMRAWVPLANIYPYTVGTTQRLDLVFVQAGGATISATGTSSKIWGWRL